MILIPRKLHYCWFGQSPLSDTATRCIASWREQCPDYEIIQWDESNCDININKFVSEAYQAQKWAFVSDYFRLKIIEENGGIYFDVDVELLKPLDDLLHLDGFMGFELGTDNNINTGHGFGAKSNHPVVTLLRRKYETIPFILPDGSHDTTPCPVRDTKALVEIGLKRDNQLQIIQGMTFLPADYLSPRSFFGQENFTNNTYAVHHYQASWADERQKKINAYRKKLVKLYGTRVGGMLGATYAAYREITDKGWSNFIAKIRKRYFK